MGQAPANDSKDNVAVDETVRVVVYVLWIRSTCSVKQPWLGTLLPDVQVQGKRANKVSGLVRYGSIIHSSMGSYAWLYRRFCMSCSVKGMFFCTQGTINARGSGPAVRLSKCMRVSSMQIFCVPASKA